MIERKTSNREQMEIIGIDQLVPAEHLLRKVEKAINFDEIYEMTKRYYCSDNGRPAVDPVILVKMLFIQHLFGIPSLRKTVLEIEVNVAYRWFLGFGLTTAVPHFSTISYAFATRFPETLVEQIFNWILSEAVGQGFVDSRMVFVDSTPVKANANRNRKAKKWVENTAKNYENELREEINADRIKHGKKPFDDDDGDLGIREVMGSKTDPDSGILRKGEHKVDFSYSVHTACDKNNFVLASEVTAATAHDSRVFETVYDKVNAQFDPEIYAADAAYKTPWLCKKVFDDERRFSLPYKRPMGNKEFFKPYEYVYDEYYDCVICPENQVLKYSTTDRNGYKQFKSDPKICKQCPSLAQCTKNAKNVKTVTKHIWSDYVELAEDFRHSPLGKESYAKRSETIERVFADAKEKHNMRYTRFRGLKRVKQSITLILAAMNLKKLATWAWKEHLFNFIYHVIHYKKPFSMST